MINIDYKDFVSEYAGKMPGASFLDMKKVLKDMMLDKRFILAQFDVLHKEFENNKEDVFYGDMTDVIIFLIENKVNGWVTDEITSYIKTKRQILFKTVNGDTYCISNRASDSQKAKGDYVRLMKPILTK